MAKGTESSGVRYFGYGRKSNTGKNHPETVNRGLTQVEHLSGSHPKHSMAKGTSEKIAGVQQHSGKENHVKVRHLNAAKSGPAKRSGANAHPDGVRKFKDASV